MTVAKRGRKTSSNVRATHLAQPAAKAVCPAPGHRRAKKILGVWVIPNTAKKYMTEHLLLLERGRP